MVQIETERLIIRKFQESDAADLYEYLSHPRVNCFLSKKLNSFDEAIENAKRRSGEEFGFAVCLKENGKVVGNLFAKNKNQTLMAWIGNTMKSLKATTRAYLAYLFNEKKARRNAYVEANNFRSQKLSERLGMRKEGCFKEFISFTKNKDGIPMYENTMQYAVLKKEWEL